MLKFRKALGHFGEDQSNLQPDVFFGIFGTFLAVFADAKKDNDDMLRHKEEKEKRALMEAQVWSNVFHSLCMLKLSPCQKSSSSIFSIFLCR